MSRSGGMSNELNNIVCLNADGAYEGVAIGGDRYRKQHLLFFNFDNGEGYVIGHSLFFGAVYVLPYC